MAEALTQYAKNITDNFLGEHRRVLSLDRAFELSDPVAVPISSGQIETVGIIGAGVGGLYAAMMLQSLDIPFEILEASDRVGGRLFTHKFSNKEHDYFDVGAMRFPKTPLMTELFTLFDLLGLPKIPYIFETENNTLLYNSILRTRRGNPIKAKDFDISGVPDKYSPYSWPDLVNNVVEPFKEKLIEDARTRGKAGWEFLMKYDQYSTTAYMTGNRSDTAPELDRLGLLPYPLGVVNWLETFDSSTGSYNNAFTETVLDTLAFDYKPDVHWYCIDGGSSVISDAMLKYLEKHSPSNIVLKLNSRVIGIELLQEQKNDTSFDEKVSVSLSDGSKRSYSHVITTTTLPCLRTMDLERADLDYMQRSSLRQMHYGAAIKIGVKFKTNWWEDSKWMPNGVIVGGQSKTDNMVRVVVYPSYGEECGEKSNVLIASYAWTSDALALAALMGPGSESALKTRVLQDLVLVHGLEKVKGGAEFLEDQWIEAFPFDWSRNPNTMGAYAFFAPGQFKSLYENMTRPAANGRLHFAGEAISVRHAWIVGALEASRRAVKQIVHFTWTDKIKKFNKLEVDDLWSKETLLLCLEVSRAILEKEKMARVQVLNDRL